MRGFGTTCILQLIVALNIFENGGSDLSIGSIGRERPAFRVRVGGDLLTIGERQIRFKCDGVFGSVVIRRDRFGLDQRLITFRIESDQAVIQLADDFPTGHIAGVTWQQAIRWFRDIDADHLIGTGDFLLGILRLHGSTARKQRNYGKRRRNRLEQTGSDAAIQVL